VHAQQGQYDRAAEHGAEITDVVGGDTDADDGDGEVCVSEQEIGGGHPRAGLGRASRLAVDRPPMASAPKAIPVTAAAIRNSARDATDIPATMSASPGRARPSPVSRTGLLLRRARLTAPTVPAAKKRQVTAPATAWLVAATLRELPALPRYGQWATFLRNHDEVDLGRLTGQERQEVFAAFAPDPNM
jgi:hypothetical protein